MNRRKDRFQVCTCGHTRGDHMYPGAFKWVDSYCNECEFDVNYLIPLCPKFVPDNIEYLRRKYEEKKAKSK